jgi:HrpA-like RNA helicase
MCLKFDVVTGMLQYPVSERGDVLMFLSGMSEIMSVADAARAYAQKTKKWIILPLHSTLSVSEQDQVSLYRQVPLLASILAFNQ